MAAEEMSAMPPGEFSSIEGELKIRDLQNQVTIEMEGDCWYSCMTFSQEAIEALADWLTLYRLARKG